MVGYRLSGGDQVGMFFVGKWLAHCPLTLQHYTGHMPKQGFALADTSHLFAALQTLEALGHLHCFCLHAHRQHHGLH
jgi:hypothetical protein